MKDDEFSQHLNAVWQGLLRAGMSLQIWWIYRNADDYPKWLDTLNRFPQFFVPDMRGHLIVAIVALHYPYDRNNRTESFSRTLRLARKYKLPHSVISKAKNLIEEANPIVKKVELLRHKRFAHIESDLTADDAFAQAQLTPDEMKELLAKGFEILNLISYAYNQNRFQNDFSDVERDMRGMLESLGESPHKIF